MRITLSIALLMAMLPALGRAAEPQPPLPPRVFAHPDRIRYDSQCFTIEGKDTFIFSGAFHYFRCPKELWNDRFDKIKSAGFNTVETYVAWNAAEPTMPASPDDYSKVDLKDLDDWLTLAEAHGFYVILRPGPYICAEWDCGGFPQWLITKRPADYKPMWLRSDEPSFVAWSKHWYHAVDKIAVKHQLTHRKPGEGGIILYQLENEYGGNQPDPVEVNYLRALGQQAMGDGIDVPLFTCWTAVVRGSRDSVLRQVYDSCNFYPRFGVKEELDREITKLQKQQPDAPLQTTELQGGWFSKPGDAGSLSKSWTDVIDSLSPAQIQNLTLHAIEKGDRVTNYYMLFGGTNFGDMAPANITTSYDYSAPIREIGCVGEKYQRVAAMGAILKEHGEQLARALALEGSDLQSDVKEATVVELVAKDESRFYFVRTNQHDHRVKGKLWFPVREAGQRKSVDFELEPFGSTVLYFAPPGSAGPDGNGGGKPITPEWLPNPLPEFKRPTEGLPSPITLTQAVTKADPGPVQWEPLTDGQSLEQMGIYDRRFVFYRTQLDTPVDATVQPASPILSIVGPSRDNLLSFVDGKCDPALNRLGGHRPTQIHPGKNSIQMIYENVGQPNGGRGMEEMSGIRKIETLVTDGSIADWRMKKITKPADRKFRPERLAEVKENAADQDWAAVKIASDEDATQLAENEDAVFRATVNITAEQLKTGDLNLELGRMDDEGWVFINGKKIGEAHDWASAFTFPAAGLHEGANSIAVVIRNVGGSGGLGIVRLLKADEKQPGLPIEIGRQSTGFAGQWWKNDLDETGWATTPIGQPLGEASQLQWSRMKFELPEVKKGIWVPWVARLTTSGNGFLFLNGHALGRYWQQGPQHDFFLPECWLNFGPGSKNVLTMCLRSVDGKPVTVESAVIVPVNEVAEFR